MKKILVLIIVSALLIAGFLIKVEPAKNAIDYSGDETLFIAQIDSDPVTYALTFYGVEEAFTNGKSNPLVVSFFKDFADWVTNSKTTAWCSAYVNSIAASCGYQYTGKLNARSWLNIGNIVNSNPKVGDVVIFWRNKKDGWEGHVGFFISYSPDKKYINVLGGNQGNKVTIAPYPVERLLGIRRLEYIRDREGNNFRMVNIKYEQ